MKNCVKNSQYYLILIHSRKYGWNTEWEHGHRSSVERKKTPREKSETHSFFFIFFLCFLLLLASCYRPPFDPPAPEKNWKEEKRNRWKLKFEKSIYNVTRKSREFSDWFLKKTGKRRRRKNNWSELQKLEEKLLFFLLRIITLFSIFFFSVIFII